MLGGFELRYNGKEYAVGRSSTVKYMQLLQFVWIHGDTGVTKEQIINNLYDRESLLDSNNSFSNLLYQMRRQMAGAGLPKCQYIVRQDGCYIPDKSISVHIDTADFENYIEKAGEAAAEEEVYQYYRKALEIYRGELLPDLSTELWVMMESARYKSMFQQCVNWMGTYLKKQRDYEQMGQIYSIAAEIYPYDEWQTGQIESLLCRGKYKEAYLIYENTVKRYSEDMGWSPSENLKRCFRDMDRWMNHEKEWLQDIRRKMDEWLDMKKDFGHKPYYCEYPEFVNLYGWLTRRPNYGYESVILMLCTIVDYEGKPLKNHEKLKQRVLETKEIIQDCIGMENIFTQYNSCQFLILLLKERRADEIEKQIKIRLKREAGSTAAIICNTVSLR